MTYAMRAFAGLGSVPPFRGRSRGVGVRAAAAVLGAVCVAVYSSPESGPEPSRCVMCGRPAAQSRLVCRVCVACGPCLLETARAAEVAWAEADKGRAPGL